MCSSLDTLSPLSIDSDEDIIFKLKLLLETNRTDATIKQIEWLIIECSSRNINLKTITNATKNLFLYCILHQKYYSLAKTLLKYLNVTSRKTYYFMPYWNENVYHILLHPDPYQKLSEEKINMIAYITEMINPIVLNKLLNQQSEFGEFGYPPMLPFLTNDLILELPERISSILLHNYDFSCRNKHNRTILSEFIFKHKNENAIEVFEKFIKLAPKYELFQLLLISMRERIGMYIIDIKKYLEKIFKELFWTSYDGTFKLYSEWVPEELFNDLVIICNFN